MHTDAVAIHQSILTNLPFFISQSNPTSNADDTPMETATFSFVSLLTTDKTTAGKPVKKLFDFDLQVHQESSNELCTELAFVTISSSTTPSSLATPANIRGTIALVSLSPYPKCPTTTVTLTVSMEVSQEIESRNTGLSKSSGFSTSGIASYSSAGRKTMHKTMLPPVDTPTSPTSPSPQTASAILSHIANAVLSLHTQYARYKQVAAIMYKQFELVEVPNAPPIESHEDNLVKKSLVFGNDVYSKTKNTFKRIKVSERDAPSEPAIDAAKQTQCDATLFCDASECSREAPF